LAQADIGFELDLPQQELGHVLEEAAYRIVRESLSNAMRHGHPRRVWVSVSRKADEIVVEVSDDGKGFEPRAHRRGHGLLGMEERVKALGGSLALDERPGGGFSLTARLPCEQAREDAGREAAMMAAPS